MSMLELFFFFYSKLSILDMGLTVDAPLGNRGVQRWRHLAAVRREEGRRCFRGECREGSSGQASLHRIHRPLIVLPVLDYTVL